MNNGWQGNYRKKNGLQIVFFLKHLNVILNLWGSHARISPSQPIWARGNKVPLRGKCDKIYRKRDRVAIFKYNELDKKAKKQIGSLL